MVGRCASTKETAGFGSSEQVPAVSQAVFCPICEADNAKPFGQNQNLRWLIPIIVPVQRVLGKPKAAGSGWRTHVITARQCPRVGLSCLIQFQADVSKLRCAATIAELPPAAAIRLQV